jgi:hypothetical protein
MYPSYDDVTSRIQEEPIWWDRGFPRYCEFHPTKLTVHGKCAILAHVVSGNEVSFKIGLAVDDPDSVKRGIILGDLFLGPVPWHGGADATMRSETIAINEFWEREEPDGWHRNREFERDLCGAFDHLPPKPVDLTPEQIALAKTAFLYGGLEAARIEVMKMTGLDPFSVREWACSLDW